MQQDFLNKLSRNGFLTDLVTATETYRISVQNINGQQKLMYERSTVNCCAPIELMYITQDEWKNVIDEACENVGDYTWEGFDEDADAVADAVKECLRECADALKYELCEMAESGELSKIIESSAS